MQHHKSLIQRVGALEKRTPITIICYGNTVDNWSGFSRQKLSMQLDLKNGRKKQLGEFIIVKNQGLHRMIEKHCKDALSLDIGVSKLFCIGTFVLDMDMHDN